MARVPRFFLPVKTFFSCTSLPICWPSRGHLLCTWYIHTYCCSRACCIPTYTLQGLSLKLQVRAEPHLNLACSACYFYLKNIPVWHCSLFAHVLSRVKCLLLWKYFVSVQKYLYVHILFILNFSVNICCSVKVCFLLSIFNFENYIWDDLFLTTVVLHVFWLLWGLSPEQCIEHDWQYIRNHICTVLYSKKLYFVIKPAQKYKQGTGRLAACRRQCFRHRSSSIQEQ